jgi:CheY-like chemotaxis protein
MQGGRYQPPRLAILSDILMPGGSGYYLMHEVRKDYPQQKFIMLSATPMEEHGGDFACMYFCKPVSIERLQAALALLEQCVMCGQECAPQQCEEVDDREQFPVQDWQCPQQVVPGKQ